MSYYDFDYFWTHEEVGGKKLKVLKNQKRGLQSIEEMLKFILGNDNNHPTERDENSQKERENNS